MNSISAPSVTSCSRVRDIIPGLLALVAALILGGCASPIAVTSNPPGASITANGKSMGVTPAQITPENSAPIAIELRLDGYFPESATVVPGSSQAGVSVRMEPTTLKKNYDVTSTPDGATVLLDGRPVGTTPAAGVNVV